MTLETYCPQGWKVPSREDVEKMISSLGGNSSAGPSHENERRSILEASFKSQIDDINFQQIKVALMHEVLDLVLLEEGIHLLRPMRIIGVLM